MGETISFDLIAHDLASKAFGDAGKSAEGFAGKLTTIGGLATGVVGAGLTHLGEHLEGTRKVLEQSISNAGQSFEEFSGQIDKAASHEEKFGHSSADTNDALSVLVRATGNTKTALADMNLVTELAAVHHSSLAEAANTVAKAHAGSFKALKEFGINVKDNAALVAEHAAAEKKIEAVTLAHTKAVEHLNDVQQKLHGVTKLSVSQQQELRHAQEGVFISTTALNVAHDKLDGALDMNAKAMDFATAKTLILSKIHGTAAAQADTFGGHIKALQTHFMDMAAELGTHVGPALTVIGPTMAGIGGIISSGIIPAVGSAIASFASMAASAVASFATMIAEAAVWAASTVASIAIAVAPFLPFIVAIGAIGLAAYELYQHWDEIWGFIKKIASDAWDFIKGVFDNVWGGIKAAFEASIDAVKGTWDGAWGAIKGVVSGAWEGIKTIVGGGFGFVKGLFVNEINGWKAIWDTVWNGIKDTVTGVWDAIDAAVRGGINLLIHAVNTLIDGLDAIQIHIPSVGVGPFHTPGFDWDGLNLHHIPELRAAGGPIVAGHPYIVGERGPELVVPNASGTVVPNDHLGERMPNMEYWREAAHVHAAEFARVLRLQLRTA